MREKDPGPPEGPRKALRCLGFGAFCFVTPEGRKSSHVSGQQDPGLPGPQPYAHGVPGGPEPFPSRPWKAEGTGRLTGRPIASNMNLQIEEGCMIDDVA